MTQNRCPQESGKWPKTLPALMPEQQAIRDDFMRAHLEAVQTGCLYGLVERFNQKYPLRNFIPGCRTLEIGAGLGSHIKWEKWREQEYHANELRPELCERLKAAYPGVEAKAGNCQERLPYEEAYFDRVLAIHVLEHLPDLPAALREVYRVLKKDGLFSVVIPCEGGFVHNKIACNISARPHFEKKYNQSYDWFIASEHINRPGEILEELGRGFTINHSRYFPLLVPIININLAIGLTLIKKDSI